MTMRHTTVKRRRTDPFNGPVVLVVCPFCGAPHWVAAGPIGHCLRRQTAPFTIRDERNRP